MWIRTFFMKNAIALLFYAVMLSMMTSGCSREERHPVLPGGVTVESQIPEGISWKSLLRD
jgi:hypothetical protein